MRGAPYTIARIRPPKMALICVCQILPIPRILTPFHSSRRSKKSIGWLPQDCLFHGKWKSRCSIGSFLHCLPHPFKKPLSSPGFAEIWISIASFSPSQAQICRWNVQLATIGQRSQLLMVHQWAKAHAFLSENLRLYCVVAFQWKICACKAENETVRLRISVKFVEDKPLFLKQLGNWCKGAYRTFSFSFSVR